MPVKKGKGGKKKRKGKNHQNLDKRKLEFANDGQAYARVMKMLGDGRLEAKCSDGETRLCHIRGKFRKRVWINPEDLVLVDIRDFQPDKADVIHKYTNDEDITLQSYGELINGTAKEDTAEKTKQDRGEILFDNVSESNEEDALSEDNGVDEMSEDIDGEVEDILDNL